MDNNKDFYDIINAIIQYRSKYPMLRFGQIIVNVLGEDPFYTTDEDALKKFNAELKDIEDMSNE